MLKLPLVTYAGEISLFQSLQADLKSSLTQENVEWRRSFGRPNRCVRVEIDFAAFCESSLSREHERSILGFPLFHTYWTECSDVETYKTTVRDDLQQWIQKLRANAKSDWMIILVETLDSRKSNKLLPRTTVLDKLKNDFGGKHSERCISLINPSKLDSRSADSWQIFISKMRQLVMVAYNRSINRFEEYMRSERERRNEKGWSFFSYFLIQEELALVYKLLSLNDESLVQYDELDALITQFIRNSALGDIPQWLLKFSEPCERWEGFSLIEDQSNFLIAQNKIKEQSISLLEFRNYLFKCQASLLIAQNKPWELAARALSFLQNTIAEFRILDGSIINGGLACWGFLSCFEIIHLLGQYKHSSTTDLYAMHSAPLVAYARDKLKELGKISGLLPGVSERKAHLHMVVSLVCGMGDDPHFAKPNSSSEKSSQDTQQSFVSPMTRLKDALSSTEAFKKQFLDLSEVAISTYKHIGRLRSARLIGMDLASFYIEEGNKQHAATLLSDQLKTFVAEGWNLLAMNTLKQLAECYKATGDHEKYLKSCLHLSASPSLGSLTDRVVVFDDFIKSVDEINSELPSFALSTDRLFEIGWMKVMSADPITLDSEVKVELVIDSKLPTSIQFELIQVQLKHVSDHHCKRQNSSLHPAKSKSNADIQRKQSSNSASPRVTSHKHPSFNKHTADSGESNLNHSRRHSSIKESGDVESEDENANLSSFLKKLDMEYHLDYKQDKSLATVYVNCRNLHKALRRDDSLGGLEDLDKSAVKEEFTDCLAISDICINPGRNVVHVKTKVSKNGVFASGQVVLMKKKIEFVCDSTLIRGKSLSVVVVNEKTRVFLSRKDRELLAGILQPLILTIKNGSFKIEEGTKIHLKCSRGLQLRLHEDTNPRKNNEGGYQDGKNSLAECQKLPQKTEQQNSNDSEGNCLKREAVLHPDSASNIHNTQSNTSCPVNSELSSEIEIDSPEVKPFTSVTLQIQALADLVPRKDLSTIEYNVCIASDFLEESRVDVILHFIPPLVATHKLQTANLKKFIQVTVSGTVRHQIELSTAMLKTVGEEVLPLEYMNPVDQKLIVSSDQFANCLWELPVDYSTDDAPNLRFQFSISYRPVDFHQFDLWRTFGLAFDIHNYKTLFTIRARVEPMKGTEFCRAGTMCHFCMVIEATTRKDTDANSLSTQSHPPTSIMYEVLTDQAMWAVCGKTSGVLSCDDTVKQNVILDVMPLIGGFLPLPSVRLSKYIPAESQISQKETRQVELVGSASSVPRLEPFKPGQVYNFSKALQVHVLPAPATSASTDPSNRWRS